MGKRQIIKIDEVKCNGCGLCIPNCPEGAIQVVDGKARLLSALFCDGLGACLGYCPQGAITIEEREAEEYNERKVMENIIKQGKNVIVAHLKHLKEHNQNDYLKDALDVLKEKNIDISLDKQEGYAMKHEGHGFEGCPGSRIIDFETKETKVDEIDIQPSELRQWPIQLHLVSPAASYYQKADVLLAADCVAYALGNFHKKYLKGKALAVACPKLDTGQDKYLAKITSFINDAQINTITVMIMQVPCCKGLLDLIQQAMRKAKRKIPIKSIVVSLQGDVLSEEWL